jgi:exopolysaccharide/PEP-CTERM locus tyrosine autokinase
MSLVEQALARLRQTNAAKTGNEENHSEAAAPAPRARARSVSAGAAKRLTLDLGRLRAAGYLPEESRDRQFANHYRQIKRPLIEKASSAHPVGVLDSRLIMVTSALPGDGKTFTSVNLALSMARERDISVLLVDADTPKPRVSEIFGLLEQPGLMDALEDETLAIDSLIVPTNVRGLSLLPAGRPMEGASELFSSDRMHRLLISLVSNDPRRIVLLDSPPLLITSEGRALVKIAGQVLLVVCAGQTPQHAVRDAIALIDEKQAGGLVLNQGRAGFTESYYGYGAYGSERDDDSAKQ